MRSRAILTTTCLSVVMVVTGCGSDDKSPSAAPESDAPTPATSTPAGPPVERTPELDSVVVMGHSGATGFNSDGSGLDIRNNSWATGDNPEVNSVYRRLLATHPALKGHSANVAVSGSNVDALELQVEAFASLEPVPDLVIIQSIDNDIRCDGSDPDNYGPFEEKLDNVLTLIDERTAGAQVYFVDQYSSVKIYDDVIATIPRAVEANSGTGPCDPFTPEGERVPEAEAYSQEQVDAYFDLIVEVCARHEGCYTDGGALQQMKLTPEDLSSDFSHLSVQGQHTMAQYAWDALPDDIRDAP